MSLQETCSYIDHPTARYGRPTSIFADDAKADIHRHAGGLPRLVNTLCYRPILHAAANDISIIDSSNVVSDDLSTDPLPPAISTLVMAPVSGATPASDRDASWQLYLAEFGIPGWPETDCHHSRWCRSWCSLNLSYMLSLSRVSGRSL